MAYLDERYGHEPDALLDVCLPGEAVRAGRPLPVLVWTHGGAFVGGSKEELGGYLRMIAARGVAVVAVAYSLSPEARYPTAVRQVMAALHHLAAHRERLGLDTDRIVLAGDSAGAQLTAQTATLITNSAMPRRSASRRSLPRACGAWCCAAASSIWPASVTTGHSAG